MDISKFLYSDYKKIILHPEIFNTDIFVAWNKYFNNIDNFFLLVHKSISSFTDWILKLYKQSDIRFFLAIENLFLSINNLKEFLHEEKLIKKILFYVRKTNFCFYKIIFNHVNKKVFVIHL